MMMMMMCDDDVVDVVVDAFHVHVHVGGLLFLLRICSQLVTLDHE